ncbi:MAG TPA: fused MFS/spermidine synthase [Patescibacteria group bacterium]|nr:fused MFS/spermidine synthase [Patescibacteria group bacterium]
MNIKLETIIFLSGAVVMILEIVGSRVLAPGLGSSTFIWTSLIGVILGSLSLGYWLGGRLADQNASYKTLSEILFISGIAVFVLNLIKTPILVTFSDLSDLRSASLITGILLFAPSSILLGMVSPYTVRLKLNDLNTSGTTVGTLYALSTLGSIFGTFLAGYILISFLGTSRIIAVLSVALIALSLAAENKTKTALKILAFVVAVASIWFITLLQTYDISRGYIDVDTEYSRVILFNSYLSDRPVRNMSLNKQSSSAMFLDGDDLVFEYTKYYNLGEHFKPGFKSALMIGGAAYSYPKEFLKRYPEATLDVVEIDPQVTDLAKTFFNLKTDPRLAVYHEDGRTFLNKNSKEYDVIYGDAFSSMFTIPYHLTTVEAVDQMYRSLNNNGVVLVNIISAITGEKGRFLQAEYNTFTKVFPAVYVFRVKNTPKSEPQNLMLVALKNPIKHSLISDNPELNVYLQMAWTPSEKEPIGNLILTDEYAPVEYLTMKMLK